MKRWILILTLIAATCVTAYVVCSWIIFHDEPSGAICTGVNIEVLDSTEEHYVTPARVHAQLQKMGQDPVGLHFSEVHPNHMEQAILTDPMVRTADCSKLINGTVRILVTQRRPVLRVCGRENYYVDSERHRIPTSREDASLVPVVTGCPTEQFVRHQLLDFVEYLEKDSFWRGEVEQINVTQSRKVQVVPRRGNFIIQLGSLRDYPLKLRKVQALYERGFQKQGWPDYSIIDVEFKDQIVCRRRGV